MMACTYSKLRFLLSQTDVASAWHSTCAVTSSHRSHDHRTRSQEKRGWETGVDKTQDQIQGGNLVCSAVILTTDVINQRPVDVPYSRCYAVWPQNSDLMKSSITAGLMIFGRITPKSRKSRKKGIFLFSFFCIWGCSKCWLKLFLWH